MTDFFSAMLCGNNRRQGIGTRFMCSEHLHSTETGDKTICLVFSFKKKKKNVLPVESKTRQKQYEYHAEQGLFLEQNQDQNLFPVAKCMLWLRRGKKRSSSRTTDKPNFKKQMQEQRVRANRLGQEKENFSPIHLRNICVLLLSFCSFSQES